VSITFTFVLTVHSARPPCHHYPHLAQLGRRVTAKGAKMGDHLLVAAATRQCRRAATYIGNARQVQEGLATVSTAKWEPSKILQLHVYWKYMYNQLIVVYIYIYYIIYTCMFIYIYKV